MQRGQAASEPAHAHHSSISNTSLGHNARKNAKMKSIRLIGDGDHETDCRMDGGSFMLKACFLKKA